MVPQIQVAEEVSAVQQRFTEKIQGNRRDAGEDDSGIAFGESLAEKFGEQVRATLFHASLGNTRFV